MKDESEYLKGLNEFAEKFTDILAGIDSRLDQIENQQTEIREVLRQLVESKKTGTPLDESKIPWDFRD